MSMIRAIIQTGLRLTAGTRAEGLLIILHEKLEVMRNGFDRIWRNFFFYFSFTSSNRAPGVIVLKEGCPIIFQKTTLLHLA